MESGHESDEILLLAGGIAALALAASATLPAFANGGTSSTSSPELGANADTGVPFFGWVRDRRAKPFRAIVTATVQNGADGEA